MLNSPRSVEACKRQGIRTDDLLFVSKEQYGKIFAAERLDDYNLQVRFDHMEKRRQERVRIVTEQRFKLIEMEKAGIDPFASHGSFKGNTKGTTAGLLGKEANMIAKMKRNQQKEIEQMLQHELELQSMRQKNEEKAQQQAERESRRQHDVEEKRRLAERKRLDYEEDKKKKLEEEDAARKRLEAEADAKDHAKEEEKKRLDREKRREAKDKEDEQRKKQEELKLATEKILEEQRQQVLKRKQEMQFKDEERKQKQDEERKLKLDQTKAKQEHHLFKIEEAKQKGEQNMVLKRNQYDEKEKVAEEKKRMYEDTKQRMREDNEKKFQKKEELIERAKKSNQETLLKKKDDYFDRQQKNKDKLRIQEEEQRRLQEDKKRQEKENQKLREEARLKNLNQLEHKKTSLIKKAEEKDVALRSASEKKAYERALKNNLEQMKKLDKLEQVKRNERKKDWERQKLMGKILDENEKIDQLKHEKGNLLKEKAEVKAKIDRDKEELAKKFQLVKEGKLNPNALMDANSTTGENGMPQGGSMRSAGGPSARGRSMQQHPQANKVIFSNESVEGVNSAAPAKSRQPPALRTNQVKSSVGGNRQAGKGSNRSTYFEVKPGETLEAATIRLKDAQGKEMLRVLEEESKEKNNRDSELLVVTEMLERKRLAKIHGVQESRAKERIMQIMKRHEDELEGLRSKIK